MSLFDKLTSFVKAGLRININTENTSNKNEVHQSGNIVNLIIGIGDKVDKKELSRLQEIIRGVVGKKEALLLEEGDKKTLDEFSGVDRKKENRELIDFFRGKIAASDLEALRAGLYIREVFDRGEPAWNLKSSVIQKYGKRGANIVNLCTAGYFTSYIKPLYKRMFSQSNFSPEEFNKIYDEIVTQYPFAVFVGQRMSEKELEAEVKSKMEMNKKYGINQLNLHGIGEDNVSKIQRLLERLRDRFTSPYKIVSSGDIFISVTIFF